MLIEGTLITVPPPKSGEQPITINLKDILIAESRQGEVAIVTPMKAPELLALFNAAWRDVDKFVKQLAAAKITAEHEVDKRRAHMLLNEVSEILKSKGIDSTKDTRDAVIILDTTYQQLQEYVDQVTATCEYLKGKLKSFENAFTSVKKIMGEDTYNMAGRIGNQNLRHGAPSSVAVGDYRPLEKNFRSTGESTPGEVTPKPTVPRPSGYGKSRY